MSHEEPDVDQLEQTFAAVIQEAFAKLSEGRFNTVKLNSLWQSIESSLNQLSDADQLRLAGQVIVKLSELCQAKAERWLVDWEDQHHEHETDPLMDDELLAGLIQRTMYLELSDLVKSKSKPSRRQPQSGSVVGAVDKKKLLETLNTIEAQKSAKQQALAVSHDEDVSAWTRAIAQWLERRSLQFSSQGVWFSELCTALHQENPRMTPVKVFLALLLGGYQLEQCGDFYASDIFVKGSH